MTEPIRASQIEIEAPADLDPQELERRRAVKAVKARQAKRQGLKRAGVDTGQPSADLACRLEESAEALRNRSAQEFRARKAARAALRQKRGGDAA